MSRLGCGQWQVGIVGRTGAPILHSDVPFVAGEYKIGLDETYQARVLLGECCDLLSEVRAVRHALVFYRDGQARWGGPIVRVNYRTGEIVARDITWWFDRRVISTPRTFVGVDLAIIAETLIRDTLAIDDPGILAWLQISPCGITGDRTYLGDGTEVVGEALRELARSGVDYTALGWRLIVGGAQIDTRPAGVLTDDHFVTLPDVIDDGLALATRTVVSGSGVVGSAGGISPYFGLVEREWVEQDILDVPSATAAAQSRLDLIGETPLIIGDEYGDGFAGRLSPSAPITMDELVPGALIRVALTTSCRDVVADLRLRDMTVRITEDDESVTLTLQTIGTI
jgi:hypothetical protein